MGTTTNPQKAPRPVQILDKDGNDVSASNPLPIGGASLALLQPPGSHAAITPSDSTNVSAVASIGLLVTADGTLAVRGVTTSSTTVSFPVVAGQYVYGSFSRVMAATTATVVGLAP